MSEVVILDSSIESIQYLCRKDKRLAKVIKAIGPLSYSPHTDDSYSFLIHEIIEQTLSVKAGVAHDSQISLSKRLNKLWRYM